MPSRCFLIAIFIVLVPGAAFAGPLDWTYTSRFHQANQSGNLNIYVGNGGEGAGGSYVLEAALQGLSEAGHPFNPGASPIVVGHFVPMTYNAAWQTPPSGGVKNFELDVLITDTTSGQSGTAAFFGTAYSVMTTDATPNPSWLIFDSGLSQSLLLGANRYDMELSQDKAVFGGNGDVVASINVRPAETPEPASLMLAAVGLLVVIVRRSSSFRG